MNKKNVTSWPAASHAHYARELREQGASEEYIKKELAELEKEKSDSESGFYQDDNLQIMQTKVNNA